MAVFCSGDLAAGLETGDSTRLIAAVTIIVMPWIPNSFLAYKFHLRNKSLIRKWRKENGSDALIWVLSILDTHWLRVFRDQPPEQSHLDENATQEAYKSRDFDQ